MSPCAEVRRSKAETQESSREVQAALRREAALTSSLDASNALLFDLKVGQYKLKPVETRVESALFQLLKP